MRVIVVRFHVQIKQDNHTVSRQHSDAQHRNSSPWFTQAVKTLPYKLSHTHLIGIYVVNNNYEMNLNIDKLQETTWMTIIKRT